MHRFLLPTCALALAAGAHAQTLPDFTTFGDGCPAPTFDSLYEQFPTGTGDLAGTGLYFTNNGSGYDVSSQFSFDPSAVNNLGLGDDALATGVALPFAFPLPLTGGTTSTIDISSNGFIGLISGNWLSSDFSESVSELLAQDTRIAMFWDDLSPQNSASGAAGGVFADALTGPDRFVISFIDVPEFPSTGSNTFQCVLYANGDFQLAWQSGCTNDGIAGFTAGNGAEDPGSSDLSSGGPFMVGASTTPITLSGSAPAVGGAFNFFIDNAPADAATGILNFGPNQLGIALDFLGLPGCTLYSDIGFSAPLSFTSQSASINSAIPNDPTLSGLTYNLQAIALSPSSNTQGAVLSNGASFTIGDPNVTVSAEGSNSFGTDGMFRVVNNQTQDITAVRLDWAASSNPAQATMVWDTDQSGMGDRPDGGNSTVSGCTGTYRAGSDATTGLDYTVPGQAVPPCDPAATSGWVGTDGGAPPASTSLKTLDFAFTSFNPGEVFVFDCDTDFGAGINGSSMEGLVVTITLADGTMQTGELASVSASRSEVVL